MVHNAAFPDGEVAVPQVTPWDRAEAWERGIMQRAWFVLGVAGLVLAVAGLGMVEAGVGRRPQIGPLGSPVSIEGKGGGCGMGAAMRDDPVSVADQDEVLRVTLTRKCRGPAVAYFEAQTSTPSPGQAIYIGVGARCIGPAGLANGCTPGQMVGSAQGFPLLDGDAGDTETSGMVYFFESLKRGRWRFVAEADILNSATIYMRTMSVEAFTAA